MTPERVGVVAGELVMMIGAVGADGNVAPLTLNIDGSIPVGTANASAPILIAGLDQDSGLPVAASLDPSTGGILFALSDAATIHGADTTQPASAANPFPTMIVPAPPGVGDRVRIGQAFASNAATHRAAAGQVTALVLVNRNAAVRYFGLINKATTPIAGDTIVLAIPVPAQTQMIVSDDFLGPNGFYLSTGVSGAWSTTTGTVTLATASDHDTVVMGY